MATDDEELKLAREIVAEHKPDTRLSRMMLDIYAHHEGFLVQIALAAIQAGRAAEREKLLNRDLIVNTISDKTLLGSPRPLEEEVDQVIAAKPWRQSHERIRRLCISPADHHHRHWRYPRR